MYTFLLTLRMLRKRRLTWLCVSQVALGLGALIVVQSVMSGFASEVRDRIKGTLADMSISKGQSGFPDYEDILTVVRATEGVQAASPVLEGLALIRLPDKDLGRDFTRWCYFWGVDPEAEAQVSRFAEWCVGGPGGEAARFRVDGRPVEHAIVLGQELATARIREVTGDIRTKLLRDTGDTVVLSTVAFHGAAAGGVTSYLPFTMAGTWRSGMSEMDSQMAFVPLESAQLLRKMPGRITKIHVRLTDYARAREVEQTLRANLEPFGAFIITTWEQERSTLLTAVSVELNIMIILLFLIIVVAGFSIMGILRMIVAEKMRDIGVIRALGGSRRGVASIFLLFGLAIGAVGCVLGTVAGLLFTANINAIEGLVARLTGRQVFDRSIYYFDEIPAVIDAVSIMGFAVGVLVVCLAASVWPAWRASRLDPVEAIRYE